MEPLVISVKNVNKAYRIWARPISRLTTPLYQRFARFLPKNSTLQKWLVRKATHNYQDFWALRNISFDVKRGESVGIIGRNGSGKSTLLQIICGTLRHSSGDVKVNGRVAALLELGSGFNPEFTGRENVFLYGSVLGFKRAELISRFNDIAAFAEIGNFIDQPVKTYSSGMQLRLAFAVAIAVDPQVLVIDEALSVGDVFFQQKCFARIKEMIDRGTTLFLVSHDLGAVQSLCTRAVLLKNGEIAHIGAPEECVSRFYAGNSDGVIHHVSGERRTDIFRENLLTQVRTRHGNKRLELLAAQLCDSQGLLTRQANMGETLHIDLLMRANDVVQAPACGIHLFDRMNNLVFGAGTPQLGVRIPALKMGDILRITFRIRFSVQPGPYTFNLAVAEPDPQNPNLADFYDVCEGLGPVEILAPREGVWPFYGFAQLEMKIDVHHA